ncbi:MAG: pantoate--beta-alanine ligase [Balneolia bacterium]|nr:pantoate--beta-alanine ligase [Balneolia bacterium]
MFIAKTVAEIRTFTNGAHTDGHKVGFVPTMGALHEGHLDLIRLARSKAKKVVVSIFVNPTQFGPGEDFEAYPRRLEDDLEKCRKAGADAVFCPERDEVYGGKTYIKMSLSTLGNNLCGASRPGHFDGVIQIVNKLFNMVKPDVAVFGQKDIQQFRILEQMAAEFNHDIDIVMGQTVRAADGLALSSRNVYLDRSERIAAPQLFATLQKLSRELAEHKGQDDVRSFVQKMAQQGKEELEKAGFKPDYLQLVEYDTLQPPLRLEQGKTYVLAAAAYLGKARLIDNVLFSIG